MDSIEYDLKIENIHTCVLLGTITRIEASYALDELIPSRIRNAQMLQEWEKGTKQEQDQPNPIYLNQEDVNILLDALHTLVQDVWIDTAYSEQGRNDILIAIWSLLDSFFQLYKQNIREGVQAIPRYQVLPADPTIPRYRRRGWMESSRGNDEQESGRTFCPSCYAEIDREG